MSHDYSVRRFASLCRKPYGGRPVVLLGAGASFTSGVPLADSLAKLIVREHYAEFQRQPAALPEDIEPREWRPWLENQSWFISGKNDLSANFPMIVERFLGTDKDRAETLITLLKPKNISPGYQRLAELMHGGYINTILTVNFDNCLLAALHFLDKTAHIAEVNRGVRDNSEFDINNPMQIIWLHGKPEQFTDRNTDSQTVKLEKALTDIVFTLLRGSPLIVIGYRGVEASIMDNLLISGARKLGGYRYGIKWCYRLPKDLSSKVDTLQEAIGSNFEGLEIDGFDELMEDVWWDVFIGVVKKDYWKIVDLMDINMLKVMCYEERDEIWKWYPLAKTQYSVNGSEIEVKNTTRVWTHIKVVFDYCIVGDFELELKISGDYIIEVQASDGTDRNFSYSPDYRDVFHKIERGDNSRFLIKRRAGVLKIAHCIGAKKKSLNWYSYQGDPLMPCLIDVAIHNDRRFKLGACVLRLPAAT